MKLTFLGAAGEVTGSCYLLENELKIMIDCGLFQGGMFAEPLNERILPVAGLQALLLTHAHLDHSGRIPKLVRDGFGGPIYMTRATRDLASLILEDAEALMVKEAKRHKKPALYSRADLKRAISNFRSVEYMEPVKLGNGAEAVFRDAGHILGSAFIEVRYAGSSVVFSGDLGNPPAPILKWPERLPPTDHLICETTYGARVHEDFAERKFKLRRAILETAKNKGVLMIPTFAMERAQELLFQINLLYLEGSIPKIPVYIDSPLSNKITQVFSKYAYLFNTEATRNLKFDPDLFSFPTLYTVKTYAESRDIANTPGPKVIIAGSGMMHGGRIIEHALAYLSMPTTTVLFVGFQVKGSLGRRLFDGEKRVRILGRTVDVKARIMAIGAYSAHADKIGLINWIKGAELPPAKIFLTHGEAEQSKSFARDLNDKISTEVFLPKLYSTYQL